jgi:glycosyltransferase involved in cell wall biosynthesis
MKKIIHFHPDGKYADKFILPLQKYEKKFGYSSILVTGKPSQQNHHKINFNVIQNPLILFLNLIHLINFMRKIKPNIIVSHNTLSSPIPLILSRLLNIKKVIYFNHGVPFIGYCGFIKYFLIFCEKVNCFFAKNIITVSHDMKQLLQLVTTKPIKIIYNGSACGIEIKQNKYKKSIKENFTKHINYKIGDIIVLYVGRPNKRKGFFDLLSIWERDFLDKPNYKLLLLGIDKRKVELFFNKAYNNIFPMSFVDDPELYFQFADYLFLTSHHEGLSYTVLEAFKNNTIVLSNKIMGVREIVKNGVNGFLVERKDLSSYYKLIIKCEKNKHLKTSLLKAGKKTVLKYDRKIFLEKYENIIKTLF